MCSSLLGLGLSLVCAWVVRLRVGLIWNWIVGVRAFTVGVLLVV